MNRAEREKWLTEQRGEAYQPVSELKPRLPPWLLAKVLETCQGQPSDLLMAWLEGHRHTRDDISRWRAEVQEPHWRDPQAVLASGESLDQHPLRKPLGGMFGALINRHAPEYVGYLPPEFINPSLEGAS